MRKAGIDDAERVHHRPAAEGESGEDGEGDEAGAQRDLALGGVRHAERQADEDRRQARRIERHQQRDERGFEIIERHRQFPQRCERTQLRSGVKAGRVGVRRAICQGERNALTIKAKIQCVVAAP